MIRCTVRRFSNTQNCLIANLRCPPGIEEMAKNCKNGKNYGANGISIDYYHGGRDGVEKSEFHAERKPVGKCEIAK